MPNHADPKVPCGMVKGTRSVEGGERQVLSAQETAARTARSKSGADMYAKLDGPPRARPLMSPL